MTAVLGCAAISATELTTRIGLRTLSTDLDTSARPTRRPPRDALATDRATVPSRLPSGPVRCPGSGRLRPRRGIPTPTARPAGRRADTQHDRPTRAVERISVGLIARVAEELCWLVTRTGLSKADVINRAVLLYSLH